MRDSDNLQNMLIALREVIQSQQGSTTHEPTANEYFALILKIIGSGGELSNNLIDMLKVLEGVIPSVSKELLSDQFKVLSTLLVKVMSSTSDDIFLYRVISILGKLLIAQETSSGFWSSLQALKIINIFLEFIDDSRTSVRKLIHQNLFNLLLHHRQNKSKILFSYLKDYIHALFRAATKSDYKRSLYLLFFLESTLSLFPSEYLLVLYEDILRLKVCEQQVLTITIYRTLDACYQSPYFSLSSDQLHKTIQFCIQYIPPTYDMETNVYVCSCLASGVTLLYKLSPLLTIPLLPKLLSILMNMCHSEFNEVHIAMSSAVRRILTTCVSVPPTTTNVSNNEDKIIILPDIKQKNKNKVSHTNEETDTYIHEIVTIIHSILQIKYQNTWITTLDMITCLFEIFKQQHAVTYLKPIIVTVSQLYEGIEQGTLVLDTERSILISQLMGTILKSCGVAHFLTCIPMYTRTPTAQKIRQNELEKDINDILTTYKGWMILLLSTYLKYIPCQLTDYIAHLLPIARQINLFLQSHEATSSTMDPSQTLSTAQMNQLRTIIINIWSLFPCFCHYGITDLPTTFVNMSKILNMALNDDKYPEIHSFIIIGLTYIARNICTKYNIISNQSTLTQDIKASDYIIVKQGASLWIPILLQLIEKLEISHPLFASLLSCITVWTTLAPQDLVITCGKNLLKQLLLNTQNTQNNTQNATNNTMDVSTQNDVAAGWVAVLNAIIPNLPETMIVLTYKTIKPLLSIHQSISLQKRAYHILESLLKSHHHMLHQTIDRRLDILHTITESLLTCHVSARNMRLRCIEILFESCTDEELEEASKNILGEILLCLKDANKKSRDSSMSLLKILIHRLSPSLLLTQLCAAVVGETVTMRVSGITGICILLLEKRQDQDLMNLITPLLDTICVLLRDQVVEETRAVLSLLRTCVNVMPHALLIPITPNIIITSMTGLGEFKAKFTSRLRAILRKLVYKVGENIVRPHVPSTDIALLDYILKQTRRANKKKQLKIAAAYEKTLLDRMLGSDSEDESDDEDDNDDEDDDMNDEDGYKNKNNSTNKALGNKKKVLSEQAMSILKSSMNIPNPNSNHMHTDDNNYNDNDDDEGEIDSKKDRRLIRIKARRPAEYTSNLPSTLDDLLEDYHPSKPSSFQSTTTTSSSSKKNTNKSGKDMNNNKRKRSHSDMDIDDSAVLAAAEDDDNNNNSHNNNGHKISRSHSTGTSTTTNVTNTNTDEPYIVTVNKQGQVVIKENHRIISSTQSTIMDTTTTTAGGTGTSMNNQHHPMAAEPISRYQALKNKYASSSSTSTTSTQKKARIKEPGEEYRSNKAGGDTWKKGMLQPHAFIPLDPKLLNKKKHRDAIGTFSAVIKNKNKMGMKSIEKKRHFQKANIQNKMRKGRK